MRIDRDKRRGPIKYLLRVGTTEIPQVPFVFGRRHSKDELREEKSCLIIYFPLTPG